MKIVSSLIVLLGTVAGATAQSDFTASLGPLGPDNYYIPGRAAFVLNASSVSFAISLGYELYGPAAPKTGRVSSTNAALTFNLGSGSGAIHSPLPWPPEPWEYDYGGSTTFRGSFVLPAALREDLVAGRTTLVVQGSSLGDFSGPVLSASPPRISRLDRQDSNLQILFEAEAAYQYTVEYTRELGSPWSSLGVIWAESRTFEAVVTDSITDLGPRFYRLRRELCCR
jgi:hypothetical protein